MPSEDLLGQRPAVPKPPPKPKPPGPTDVAPPPKPKPSPSVGVGAGASGPKKNAEAVATITPAKPASQGAGAGASAPKKNAEATATISKPKPAASQGAGAGAKSGPASNAEAVTKVTVQPAPKPAPSGPKLVQNDPGVVTPPPAQYSDQWIADQKSANDAAQQAAWEAEAQARRNAEPPPPGPQQPTPAPIVQPYSPAPAAGGVSAAWEAVKKRQAELLTNPALLAELRQPVRPIDQLMTADLAGIEKIMSDHERNQLGSKGKYYDAKLVSAAVDRYHTLQTKLKKDVDDHIAYIDLLSRGSKEQQEEARQLMASPAFQALLKEFERVNGAGERQGTALQVYESYERQRAYQGHFLAAQFNAKAQVRGVQSDITATAGTPGGYAKPKTLPYKSVYVEDERGALVRRQVQMTPEEYAELQNEQMRKAFVAARDQWEKDATAYRERNWDVGLGPNGQDHRVPAITGAMKARGITEEDIRKKPADSIEAIIDEAMAQWVRENSRAKSTDVRDGGDWRSPAFRHAYNKREAELYAYFGTTKRNVLDKTFALPVVNEAVAALATPVGLVGTPIRLAEEKLGGELTFDPTKLLGGIGGLATGIGFDTSDKAKKRQAENTRKFWEDFHKGDLFDKMRAVGGYGSQPFSEESGAANLTFQLVADPLNVVPINVLTYPSRARYVKDVASTATTVQKAKKFVRVSDAELSRHASFEADIARLKLEGVDPKVFASRIKDEIAGLPKTEAIEKIEKRLEKAGLKKTPTNARQIDALAQHAISERLRDEGAAHLTKAERAKRAKAERDAKAAADAARRAKSEADARARTVAAEEAKITELATARAKTRSARIAMEKRAKPGSWASGHTGLSEQDWLRARQKSLAKVIRDAPDEATVASARRELAIVQDAMESIHISSPGGRARILEKERHDFANDVVKMHGREVEDVIAAKRVSFYARNSAEAAVEQARRYRRALITAKRAPGGPKGHMDLERFIELDAKVQPAVREAQGFAAKGQLRIRMNEGKGAIEGPVPRDTDPKIIAAKKKVLDAEGVSIEEYDLASRVLGQGVLARNTTENLLGAAGGNEARFLALRKKAARVEARKDLRKFAMRFYGETGSEITERFRQANSYTGQAFQPMAMTAYERRTLAEAFKKLTGADPRDAVAVKKALSEGGVVPPMTDRAAFRAHMERIGEFSPRDSKKFLEGEPVWSLKQEAEFFDSYYGEVPPWADAKLIDESGFLHDYVAHQRFQSQYGGFNRELQRSLLGGKVGAEARRAVIKGGGGVLEKADIQAQRQFWKERLGSQVVDAKGNFIAMPWLMTPDELVPYYAKRMAESLPIDRTLVTTEQLPALESALNKALDRHWHRVSEFQKANPGVEIPHEFVLEMAGDITDELIAHPSWRSFFARSPAGARALSVWSQLTRAFTLWHPAFFVVNVPDIYARTSFFRFTHRNIANGKSAKAHEVARNLVPDTHAGFYDRPMRTGPEKVKNPLPTRRKRDVAEGVFETFAQLPGAAAARLEVAQKRGFAASLYDSTYAEALRRVGDPDLADAMAQRWIKNRIDKLYPTLEHAGPVYRLFNEFAPFFNYQFRNRVLWLSQAALHPAMINHFQFIGAEIARQNLENWKRDHPEDPTGAAMPAHLLSRVPLPWAPDTFMDLSVLTDAGRGLKPLTGQKGTVVDHLSGFFRLISPAPQAIATGLLGEAGIAGSWRWVENPEIPGSNMRVWVPAGEPWSGDPIGVHSWFWPADAAQLVERLWKDGSLDAGDLYQIASKLAFYSEFDRVDPIKALSDTYFIIKDRDPDAAAKFLKDHPEIRDYWKSTVRPRDYVLPNEISDFYQNLDPDRKWWYRKDPEWRAQVGRDRDELSRLIEYHDGRISEKIGTPWDPELARRRSEKRAAIAAFYQAHPDLIEAEVYSKSPAEWARTLEGWQVDQKVDEFFKFLENQPKRSAYGSEREYQEALAEFNHQRDTFLAAFPQVRSVLNSGRTSSQLALDRQRADWKLTFDRVAERKARIERAQLAGDYESAEFLYELNRLDFARLDHDQAVLYVDPRDIKGYRIDPRHDGLRAAITRPGSQLAAAVLPDFAKRREANMSPVEKAAAARDEKFAEKMSDAQRAARAGGSFDAAKFVAAVKADPWLQAEYFRRNPGKREEWAQNDEYSKRIGKWAELMKAGKFEEADRYYESMPGWVKQRYLGLEQAGVQPGGRGRLTQTPKGADRVQSLLYRDYMAEFIDLNSRGRYDEARKFLDSLPYWAQDRYYNDPVKGAERRAAAARQASYAPFPRSSGRTRQQDTAEFVQTGKYLGYMDHWVKLIESGRSDEAQKYFDSLPSWAKDRYYNDPENGAERRANRDYRAAIGGWVDLIQAGKRDEAQAYFDRLPKWVKDRYYGDAEQGAERRQTRDYVNALDEWTKKLDAGDFDGAKAYFDSLPKWMQDRYYNDPAKGEERRQARDYGNAIGKYGELIGAGRFDEARAYLDGQPQWVRDRYYNDPDKGLERRQARDYSAALGEWVAKLDQKDFDGAKAYFDSLPSWMRERYFAKHPEKRGPDGKYLYSGGGSTPGGRGPAAPRPGPVPLPRPDPVRPPRPTIPRTPPPTRNPDFVDLAKLDAYFKLPLDQQGDYLRQNPDIADWLETASTSDQRYRFAVLAGYRSLPKDAFLQRIYRERYPEVFDPELIADYRRERTYQKLGEHPELLPDYEKYFRAIQESFAESLRHQPRPKRDVQSKHELPRRRRRNKRGRSAKFVSERE